MLFPGAPLEKCGMDPGTDTAPIRRHQQLPARAESVRRRCRDRRLQCREALRNAQAADERMENRQRLRSRLTPNC
jgi:hypothetical protein